MDDLNLIKDNINTYIHNIFIENQPPLIISHIQIDINYFFDDIELIINAVEQDILNNFSILKL